MAQNTTLRFQSQDNCMAAMIIVNYSLPPSLPRFASSPVLSQLWHDRLAQSLPAASTLSWPWLYLRLMVSEQIPILDEL